MKYLLKLNITSLTILKKNSPLNLGPEKNNVMMLLLLKLPLDLIKKLVQILINIPLNYKLNSMLTLKNMIKWSKRENVNRKS